MAHGKNLKKRGPKVSRRVAGRSRRLRISHGDLRADWGRKGGPQGYARVGLVADPNKALSTPTGFRAEGPKTDAELETGTAKILEARKARDVELEGEKKVIAKWNKIDQEVALTGHGTRQARRPNVFLTEEDRLYMEKLVRKHGEDYTAMARDIDVNVWQRGPGWLRRMAQKYFKHVAHQEALAAQAAAGEDGKDSE